MKILWDDDNEDSDNNLNNDAKIHVYQSTVHPGHHEGLARDETATVVTLSSHHLIVKMMMTIYIVMKCMSVTINEHYHFYSDKNAFKTLTSLVTWILQKFWNS